LAAEAESGLGDRQQGFSRAGWAFPITVDATHEIATAAYEDDVRQAIRIILGTERGERVMRPDFGTGLRGLMFEPINTTTIALARHRVEQALTLWEPRIDAVKVTVDADPPAGKFNIAVAYRVRTTNTFYNLVYPFYLQERGG
jgi:Bacteriophage baseplate protein W